MLDPDAPSPLQFDSARVLIVEDDYHVAASLKLLLGSCGCVVVGPAPGAAEALALIESEPIDAAVLDIRLGGDDSEQIARLLDARGCPLVFVTGFGSPEVLPDDLREHPIVLKPILGDALLAALHEALASGR